MPCKVAGDDVSATCRGADPRWSGTPCKQLVFDPRGNGTHGSLKQRKDKNGLYNI